MKNVIAVLGGFYFFVASAVCSSEPLTLNNDSITKAENLKIIRIDKSSRSTVRLPTASNSQQTAAPSIRPTSGYTTIDVNGPKAPPIFSGTLIKQGPARINGRTIQIVEFWATWCCPCAQTVPLLSQVQKIYGKKNVAVVGFSTEENEALVRDYVQKKGNTMNYTVRLDPEHKTADPFALIWNVGTIPHVYIVSHKGNIVWQGFPGKVRTFETAIREAIRYRDGA